MPAEGRNTKRFYEFEGGYRLPSGKILTKEHVSRISKEAGLPTGEGLSVEERNAAELRYVLPESDLPKAEEAIKVTAAERRCAYPDGILINREEAIRFAAADGVTFDENLSNEELRTVLLSYYGRGMRANLHPYYNAWIDHNLPTPPMLQFLNHCPSKGQYSAYTINLNTLRPTKNSPIQIEIPEDIKAMLR